jgi:hypothetical protein
MSEISRQLVACIALFLAASQPASAITSDELAGIIQKMEAAYNDIEVEYDLTVTPLDPDQQPSDDPNARMRSEVTKKMTTATMRPFADFQYTKGVMTWRAAGRPEPFVITMENSWNGREVRGLDVRTGGTSASMNLAAGFRSTDRKRHPAGFMGPIRGCVLRFLETGDRTSLSEMLRRKSDIMVGQAPVMVNGFRAVRVDFVFPGTNRISESVFLAVDRGYTPVQFEYPPGYAEKVLSLQEVSPGLWFPSEITIADAARPGWSNTMKVTAVRVNQGIGPDRFTLEFPEGTVVEDERLPQSIRHPAATIGRHNAFLMALYAEAATTPWIMPLAFVLVAVAGIGYVGFRVSRDIAKKKAASE